MTNNANIKDDTPVILKKKNGTFLVYSKVLNIYGEGKNVSEAFEKYEVASKKLNKIYDKYSLNTDFESTIKRKKLFIEIRNFLIKSFIISIAFVLIIILLLPNISAAFKNHALKLIDAKILNLRYYTYELPKKLNKKFENLSENEKTELIENWRKLISRVDYLYEEMKK